MTTTRREQLTRQYIAARKRAERAGWYGDRAGQLIAAGDARRIRLALETESVTA